MTNDRLTMQLETIEYLSERSLTEFYHYLDTLHPSDTNRLVYVLTTGLIQSAGANSLKALPEQMRMAVAQ